MHRPTSLAMACALALALPEIAIAQAASAPVEAQPVKPESDQQVTITASKRKERLQDTANAVTAITAETLDRLGVEQFADYVSLVPNLAQASGSPGVGTVVLRGLNTGAQQTTATTAFYLGETPFTASGSLALSSILTPDPDLVDVARVEVLKGPQGTLFGASSLGGLIRIIPRLPDVGAFSGSVRLGASKVSGGGDGHAVRFSLNVPVSSNLALLVSAFDRKEGGAGRNTSTGATEQGWSKASGGQLSALLQLDRGWTVTGRVLSQKIHSQGGAQDNVQSTNTPLTGPREYASFDEPYTKIKYELAELSTERETAAGTLTATVSRASSSLDLHTDYTGPYGIAVASFLPPGFAILGDLHPSFKKTTAELRFASRRIGNFEGLVGLFMTDEDNVYNTILTTVLPGGIAAPAPFGNFVTGRTTASYQEQAVFASGTYYLTNDFDIGAGIRYAKNRQPSTVTRTGLLAGAASGMVTAVNSDDNDTTYQLTARWRLDRNLSTFVRYATGYRPGGPQTNANPPPGTPTTFQADTVTNLEVGVKGVALSRSLSFDASVFRIDWKDVQLNGLSGGTLLVGNAGKAVVSGLEVQVQYIPSKALVVGAALGYNDAKLKEVGTDQAANLGAVAGDRLPNSPKVSASAFMDWRFPIAGLKAVVGATVRHQGDKASSFSSPDALNPNHTMPAYTTLDLRAGVEWDRYSLRLRVDNATDKAGYTGYATNRISTFQTTLPSQASLIRPRTFSVSLGAEF